MLQEYLDILKYTYGRGKKSYVLMAFAAFTMASSWYQVGFWLGLLMPLVLWMTFVPCAIWLIDHKK